jgi:hypothetical protein
MSRTARLILIGLAAVGLLAIPISAIGATSLWDDVPDDSIFVDDTNWMKTTGVSRGCNPPQNTEYCPKEFMTREQMAAFIRRLSEGEIVNAATAVEAENADMLDGRDSGELTSITGSTSVETFPFTPSPSSPASNPVLLASLMSFDVPADGGAIQAHANATAEPVPANVQAQIGFIWIEIGGDGTCPTVIAEPAGVGYYYLPRFLNTAGEPVQQVIDTTSAIATDEVTAGTTRIDLCTAALGTQPLSINGHLSVTWNPVASGAGVAGGSAKTTEELLERLAGVLDG